MQFLIIFYSTILILLNIGQSTQLLVHGSSNSTDMSHGFPGNNIDTVEIMQMLLNQTELLKQQAAEIENFKQQTEKLRQQTENDRSSIQSLQNRVFFLEAELNKLNVSNLPTSQEFATYLSRMNQLTQNMAANEVNDRNFTHQLSVALKTLDDLKVQVRYTSLSLLDVQSMTEGLNGSLFKVIEERIDGLYNEVTSMF